MSYEISYNNGTPQELDAQAIDDTREYLGDKFQILVDLATDPETSIELLNIACCFAGVTGRPFHALARKYRLAEYIAWRTTGEDAQSNVNTQGFSDAT